MLLIVQSSGSDGFYSYNGMGRATIEQFRNLWRRKGTSSKKRWAKVRAQAKKVTG
jgi:hypothetical protein